MPFCSLLLPQCAQFNSDTRGFFSSIHLSKRNTVNDIIAHSLWLNEHLAGREGPNKEPWPAANRLQRHQIIVPSLQDCNQFMDRYIQ